MNGKNIEGYSDPTANKAIAEISREERQVHHLIHVFRDVAALAGFGIIGRVEFEHKQSGRRYK